MAGCTLCGRRLGHDPGCRYDDTFRFLRRQVRQAPHDGACRCSICRVL